MAKKPAKKVKKNAKPVKKPAPAAVKSIAKKSRPETHPVKTKAPLPRMEVKAVAPLPATVARPVPTNGKPRKNQAGMQQKELEHYRELLLLKRRELIGDMSAMEREALRTTGSSNLSNLPLHMADMGTDNYEQEFTLNLVEKDRQLLREINNALAKLQDGTYGLCEGTGKPITKARLEAQPWAKFSIEYAREQEQKRMIRR